MEMTITLKTTEIQELLYPLIEKKYGVTISNKTSFHDFVVFDTNSYGYDRYGPIKLVLGVVPVKTREAVVEEPAIRRLEPDL